MTEIQAEAKNAHLLKHRFRGYFPVIIDVETAGFNAKTDALLELAAITVKMNEEGLLVPDQTCHFHIEPFVGANINPESLQFNGIDIHNPLRGAVSETVAITELFKMVRKAQKAADCQRSIIVAHNAAFDQSFLMAAAERTGVKRNPFHPFGMFDTATLSGFMFGQTVLVKACQAAQIAFDGKQAHSALYDTERTAELFCYMVNHLKHLGGFPHQQANEKK
ncbi:TPA: ribonuclease T [Pasteurella multocida]|uniref:Ribonuclease T n=1 Tax=Pasteurella multocida TaxID=747 RepID=A0AAW8V7F4_PASMD|nr:ribonuclease T [Pasteurella multocida]MDH7436562.1 ribonuclease T [Pasteurella multocida]MDH7439637.1 ribonuclease T [Pasteurella multocida]MDT3452474.1 ribonuclease T [Pasteurella multocida]MDY0432630.1 ribonuclease T [Pasteurella multocida]MDY0436701.1 ribonuclease T [Pasteurella multocida]